MSVVKRLTSSNGGGWLETSWVSNRLRGRKALMRVSGRGCRRLLLPILARPDRHCPRELHRLTWSSDAEIPPATWSPSVPLVASQLPSWPSSPGHHAGSSSNLFIHSHGFLLHPGIVCPLVNVGRPRAFEFATRPAPLLC